MISYFKHIVLFIALLILQFIFINNFILYDYAFCFIYIAFILLLPKEISPIILILMAFGIGISVDIFSNTLGMNASASVLIAFLRPFVLNLITPRQGYSANFTFSIYETGFQWFFIYSFTLIFIHLLFLFILDASNLSLLLDVFLRAFFSTLLTVITLIIGAFLFQSKK